MKHEKSCMNMKNRFIFNSRAKIGSSRFTGGTNRLIITALITFAVMAVSSTSGFAHDNGNTRPAALRDVSFDQRLNQQVPLDVTFRDENGNTARLADYIKDKPVILSFIYFKCQDLCPLLLDGIVRTLRTLSFDVGNEFNVLTVSFDPDDTPAIAAAKKSDLLSQYGRQGAGAGWHFLTGDEPSIKKLTQAVGFRYQYDSRTGEFGHAAGIVLLTPEGKISRYFYGIEFSPRDLRLGIIDAGARKIGSAIDQLLLFCYHYDPTTGKYNLLVSRLLQIGGALTVLAIIGFITVMVFRERNARSGMSGTA